jgi:hypothetical protein
MRHKLLLVLGCVMLISGPALAQDAGSLEKRLELATKMHEFRPAREQVDNAINAVSERLPEADRENFKAAMQGALNYKAIEKISIDAMAETFTEEELTAMVEYYSKPEARSVTDKYPEYQQKVGPEIIQMIDKAMMRVRTGATGQ